MNDLGRYGWNANKLFQYFNDLIQSYKKKYPRTKFIFNSLLLTEFKWLNIEINKLNQEIFNFSTHSGTNVWFFDSHFIADSMFQHGFQIIESHSRRANGVHITYPVTNEIRRVLSHCINEWCLNRPSRDIWPLRYEFRRQLAN